MLRAIIVDDEQNSRELIRTALTKYIDEVELVGEANDVVSGVNLIQLKKPDLVLLDIELHNDTGFDILDQCENINFNVIFFTAYDHYAIKAIRYSAIDYLLKPLDLDDLEAAIKRVKSSSSSHKQNIQFLKNQINVPDAAEDQIIIPTHSGYRLVKFDEIISIKAEEGSSFFYFEDGQRSIVSKSISHYDDLIPNSIFYRIHKSHIVNLYKVVSYDAGRTGMVHMIDGSVLDIAARRKSQFITYLDKIVR